MQLADRVALVTGAGSGIGQASAYLLAREGAKVAALGRSEDELKETVARIEGEGGEAMAVIADISDAEEMEAAVRRISDRWGRIDIVFANAGVNGVWAPIDELKPEEWAKTIHINLTGTFHTVKYARALPEAARGLDHRHVVGQRQPHLQQHRRDGLCDLEGRAGRVHEDGGAGARPAPDPRQRHLPGADHHPIHEKPRGAISRRSRCPVEFPEGRCP
jgi:NAD(P)-dependent dehydrogenase (short-subunit alcohol dehydrogenase family)